MSVSFKFVVKLAKLSKEIIRVAVLLHVHFGLELKEGDSTNRLEHKEFGRFVSLSKVTEIVEEVWLVEDDKKVKLIEKTINNRKELINEGK